MKSAAAPNEHRLQDAPDRNRLGERRRAGGRRQLRRVDLPRGNEQNRGRRVSRLELIDVVRIGAHSVPARQTLAFDRTIAEETDEIFVSRGAWSFVRGSSGSGFFDFRHVWIPQSCRAYE